MNLLTKTFIMLTVVFACLSLIFFVGAILIEPTTTNSDKLGQLGVISLCIVGIVAFIATVNFVENNERP